MRVKYKTFNCRSFCAVQPCTIFYCSADRESEEKLDSEIVGRAKDILRDELISVFAIANADFAIGQGYFEDLGHFIWFEAPPTSVTSLVADAITENLSGLLAGVKSDICIGAQLKRRWIRDLYSWSLVTPCISEARSRDIPITQRWYDCVPLIEFGYGRNRRRFLGPVSDGDSGTSIMLGSNKIMGRALLQQLNLPIPDGVVINDFAEAVEAAQRIGFQVVLKSPSGSNSVGVVTGIKDCGHLAASYSYLRRRFPCGPLLLEKMLAGRYFRVLIIDGQFARASSGWPSGVCGTGTETLRDLTKVSTDLFDGVDDSLAYRLEGLLLSQELNLDSIPTVGQLVNTTSVTANWSDCSEAVHPLNVARFEAIGRSLGPSVLGIDIIAPSLDVPLLSGRDGILEINAGPGFAFHDNVAEIWRSLLNRLFPENSSGRIPIICFAGGDRLDASAVPSISPLEDRFSATASVTVSHSEFLETGLPFDLCDIMVLCGTIPQYVESSLVDAILPGGTMVTLPDYQLSGDIQDKLRQENIKWSTAIRPV